MILRINNDDYPQRHWQVGMDIVNVYCAVGAQFLNIWYPNFVLIARLSSSCCYLMIKTHDLVTWLRTSKKTKIAH
jgi:hypothetical protein